MIVLAVLLLVLSAAIVLYVIVAGATETVSLEWDALNLAWEPSALVVFLLGALTLFLIGLAMALIGNGTRRRMQQRRELKRLRQVERERSTSEATDRDQATRRTDHDVRHDERPTSPPSEGRGASAHGGTDDDSWYDTPPERR